ncbi:MAG: isoprenyl transferase [Acetivibrio sp.]
MDYDMEDMEEMKDMKVPKHIALIMDGNGRWAKKRFLPRNAGHAQGSKNVENICKAADALGVEYLTVYALSTENWSRPESEINALLKLLRNYLKDCIETSKKNNMRVRVIGDVSVLEEDMQQQILEVERVSKENTGLNFQVAINYGGRDEIIRASRKIAEDCMENKLKPEEINEKIFESYLDTKGIPEPELLIRTSGEQRLSNYLLWQLAYTEFYFTDVLWPDFNEKELRKAITFYNSRERRFGGVK